MRRLFSDFSTSKQQSNITKVKPKNAVYNQRMATDYCSVTFLLCGKEYIYQYDYFPHFLII